MQWTVGLDTNHCPRIYKDNIMTRTALWIGGKLESPEEGSDEGKLEGPEEGKLEGSEEGKRFFQLSLFGSVQYPVF
jgi:predicted transposase YdaD